MIVRLLESDAAGAARYLDGLETCFAGWGGQALFDWAFRRRCAGRVARLMVVEAEGALIAGCGLIDRAVTGADAARHRVSVLAGAWTLPAARGAGAFTRIIEFARGLASEGGSDAVVAFVHRDNPSARRLAAASAELIDSCYYRLDAPAALRAEPWRQTAPFRPARHGTHFDYDPAEFEGQFLNRLKPVAALEGEGWRALVEDGDTILLVDAEDADCFRRALCGIAARSAARGRPLAGYTTRSGRSEIVRELGFAVSPGAFTVLPSRPRTDWNLESGDRL